MREKLNQHLETFIGGEEEGEKEQNSRLDQLESSKQELVDNLSELKDYLAKKQIL